MFEPCPDSEQENAGKEHAAHHTLNGHSDPGMETVEFHAGAGGDILGDHAAQDAGTESLPECGDQPPADTLQQIVAFEVWIFPRGQRDSYPCKDNDRTEDLLRSHGRAEPKIFHGGGDGNGHTMNDQGRQPRAEQGKGAKECNVAQAKPNRTAEQEQAKYFRMPISHQRGTKGERHQQHEGGGKNEPDKVGFRAAEMLGGFPSRNGRGGKQHGTEQRSKHGVRRGKLKQPDCHAMFAVAL